MRDKPDKRPRRGAQSNPHNRFEATESVPVEDAWWWQDDPSPIETQATPIQAKSAISYNQSPDIPFDRSINPYLGCEHGCIYCYARPSHAYWGLSTGTDFESKIFVKSNISSILEQELRRPSYQPATIALGSNTDAFQPLDRKFGLSRQILATLLKAKHPVAMVTKSALILRDLDLLSELAKQDLVSVFVSITTLDENLARVMEPRAAAPQMRLRVLHSLVEAGVPCGVMVAPIIPALNDSELEKILEAVADLGATYAGYVYLRLPHELKSLFEEWLETHFPQRKNHVLSLIRQSRDGQLNQSDFGERMKGVGPFADLLRNRFQLACRRLHLNKRNWQLRTDLFIRPEKDDGQLSLF
ncbi:MAG: PA0069 family radical SAM protein [Acidobacteria bacterium]|nr:PA0069 family radical SAM protein [Acidobacteriota bacterium]MCB9398146.1 PA0069 family radical SAM protein [Acidobacteriota bacterium]